MTTVYEEFQRIPLYIYLYVLSLIVMYALQMALRGQPPEIVIAVSPLDLAVLAIFVMMMLKGQGSS
ncbi:MAG: hypothetical protein GXO09_04970 [Crenarchaeota archaeon]|nr:hypothetical protein [Thermoproteota archaeon]